MDKKIPPFFLGIEGFEAGHSAAESLTNSAQTARCILEGDRWKHEEMCIRDSAVVLLRVDRARRFDYFVDGGYR